MALLRKTNQTFVLLIIVFFAGLESQGWLARTQVSTNDYSWPQRLVGTTRENKDV